MVERIFDRDDECYVPVGILLDPSERDMLDEALCGVPPKGWARAIEKYVLLKGLGSGQRAKLRIACFFYNGAIRLEWDDARHFDAENRERFILAMRAHLDMPARVRAIVILTPKGDVPGSAA